MTHSKLSPKTIVLSLVTLLSLAATLSPPVLSLETGYDYDTRENSTTPDLYGDLKCGYLFAGITHMRLLKLMLTDKTISTSAPVGMVNDYRIRAVICTLYNVANVKIDSLWLLLMYATTVHDYHEQFIAGNENEAGLTAAEHRLIVIHNYVLDRMQKDLSSARCRPGNWFDTYEIWEVQQAAAKPGEKPHLFHIQKEVLSNSHKLLRLLTTNNAQSTYGTRYEALKTRQLFLNKLGINESLKSRLMTEYDVQVSWYGTSELLESHYQYAHTMYSPTANILPLFSIKMYYTAVYSLYKCILYRLTWKFLLYVNMLTGKRREMHLNKWHDFLVDFQKLLHIEDDPEITSLLDAIDRLVRNELVINNVIEQLCLKLHKINVCLHCKATNQMILKPDELPSSAQLGNSDQAAIDWNSVKDAQEFIAQLRCSFRMVDFGVIRSIMKYVEDESKW